MTEKRRQVIACATVVEELLPLLPPDIKHQVLDFGLHLCPGELKRSLQQAIDIASTQADVILLGYGLCSLAVVGLRANSCTLVIPRVDDCIALFLGSRDAYREQASRVPGTYYLTKGWIEAGDTPFEEHNALVERYGEEKANRMTQLMLKNYTRLAFINTGQYDVERYREYTRETSARFGLQYDEIEGSPRLAEKMLFGPWDDEFLVVPPGGEIRYEDFTASEPAAVQQ
ncbi:MAG: DUF1638 domain-containing protein [Chloroflexi bacterium]|nr:DUF1638 domain-containing protein [Chloroflexota bacterium]